MQLQRHSFSLPALALALFAATGSAGAQEIKRVVDPGATLPFASVVTVPGGSQLTFVSGTIADVANPDAPKGSPEAYGDTKTQAASILGKIDARLHAEGLSMSDVVKVNVYLVGDPKLGGKMDFAGLNAAYGLFFGSAAQPNKAARTTVQVMALPLPAALVEIEVIAARAPVSGK
jgi:enamine deaminase RidA (YjgF/YER057c/UK114 family)